MPRMNDDAVAAAKREIREGLFNSLDMERLRAVYGDEFDQALDEVRRDLAPGRLEGQLDFGLEHELDDPEERDLAEDRTRPISNRRRKTIAGIGAAALALTAGVVWVANTRGEPEPDPGQQVAAGGPVDQDAPGADAPGADVGADDGGEQPAVGDAPRLDDAKAPIAVDLDRGLEQVRSPLDDAYFDNVIDSPDPTGDWFYTDPDETAGLKDPQADIVKVARETVDYRPYVATFENQFGNTDYPCGRSDDAVTVVCPDATPALPGPGAYAAVVTWMDGEIGPDTEASELIYAYVVDSDGDPANDWQPQGDYTWDFFQGTDTWFELVGAVGSDRIDWRIDVSQVTSAQQIVAADLPVRAMVTGNAVVWIVPAQSVPVDAPYRVSAFAHDGTYAPESSGGDVPGADPTSGLSGG